MRRIVLPALALLLAACSGGGGGSAQPSPLPADLANATPVPVPPIFGLLGERETLQLTSAQVTSLDSIAEVLRQRNAPVDDSLRAFYQRRGRPRSRRAQQEIYRDALPILNQLWTSNRRATEDVREVLTPTQRDKVCQRQRERRGEDRNGGVRETRSDTRPRTVRRMDVDSIAARAVRGWAWCTPTTPTPAAGARTDTTRSNATPARPDTVRRP